MRLPCTKPQTPTSWWSTLLALFLALIATFGVVSLPLSEGIGEPNPEEIESEVVEANRDAIHRGVSAPPPKQPPPSSPVSFAHVVPLAEPQQEQPIRPLLSQRTSSAVHTPKQPRAPPFCS